MKILLVGLASADADAFATTLVTLGDGELLAADTVPRALDVLRLHEVHGVVVGSAAVPDGRWEDAAAELRRLAPAAALVALAPAEVSGFDDTLRRDEVSTPLLLRVLRSARAIARAQERLAGQALQDPLTDVLNRRGLERALIRETSGRDRGQGPLSALLVDCDDFKLVNDLFGLPAGDVVLRKVAGAIRDAVRTGDTVARVGGDEFVVLLPNTRTWEAVEVAERIRSRIRGTVTLEDGRVQTVSIGVRRMDGGCSSVGELLGATEQGLKASKAVGKDQVRVVQPGATSVVSIAEKRGGEVSMPPGSRMFAFRTVAVTDLVTGRPVFALVEIDLPPDEELTIGTQRATHSPWDLTWFQAALSFARSSPLPLHARLYPGTLLEAPARSVLGMIPKDLDPQRVTLSLDEQFLSGNPSALRPRLAPFVERGVSVCIEAADLGRSCFESLILVRPHRILLDPQVASGVAASRSRRAGLQRFVAACESLAIGVIAHRIALPADLEALKSIGVRYATPATS